MFIQNSIAFSYDLPDLICKRGRTDAEMYVGRADLKVSNEDIAQAFIKILSGMYGDMLAMLIEQPHNETKSDYFGPRPENGHYFHIDFSGQSPAMNLSISEFALLSSLRSSSTEILSSFDEYSVVRAGVNSTSSLSSGRTGKIT